MKRMAIVFAALMVFASFSAIPAEAQGLTPIRVLCDQSGALVYVNGVQASSTGPNLTVFMIPGSVAIRVEKPGFQSYETVLRLGTTPMPLSVALVATGAGQARDYRFQFIPLSGLVDLRAAVRGPGRFIVAGDGGRQYSSFDGRTWTAGSRIPVERVSHLAWGDGQYLAIGEGGKLASSPDGVYWTPRHTGTSQDLTGLVWTGSRFVASGKFGTLLTSPDGVDWTAVYIGTFAHVMGVAHAYGRTVAVCADGTVLYSTEGSSWGKSGLEAGSGTAQSIDAGPLGFAAATSSADGRVYYSADGIAWERVYQGAGRDGYGELCWDGGNFLVSGFGRVLLSPDGRNWTSLALPASKQAGKAASGAGTIVVTAADGSGVFVGIIP